MRFRPALASLAVLALAGVSASAGDGSTPQRNGRIVFAADRGDQPQLVVTELRWARTKSVKGTGGAEQPATSPDGRFVAFSVGTGGSDPALWVIRSDGTRRHRVGDGCEPTWSPDGRRLAFLRRTTQQAYCYPPELVVVNRDGSGLHPIYEGIIRQPRWSPDGAWIAFVQQGDSLPYSSDLYLIRPDGSDPHPVVRDLEPYGYDWSPDGRRLVFVLADARDQDDLYTVPVDGGGVTRITDDAQEESSPRWSPDGTLIAFSSYTPNTQSPNHVAVIDASGGPVRIVGEGFQPEWSSDGRLAFFANAGIMVTRLDRSTGRLVVHTAMGAFFQDLAWLPNGRGITFTRSVFGNRSRLFSMREDGARVRRLTPRRQAAVDPAWAPNGRLIAFSRVQPAGNREIAVMRGDGGHARTVTRNRYGWDYQPTWSPDGTRIAFVRSESFVGGALLVVRAAGGNARVLWAGDRPFHPAWSPDGRSIAVDGIRDTTTPGIRVISLVSGRVEEVTHPTLGAVDVAADWSPDGRMLAFVRRVRGHYTYERVWTATLATGEAQPITEFVPSANIRARWSVNGTMLAAITCLRPDIGYCVSAGVATMRPDGSESQVVWSREGFYPLGLSWGASRPR